MFTHFAGESGDDLSPVSVSGFGRLGRVGVWGGLTGTSPNIQFFSVLLQMGQWMGDGMVVGALYITHQCHDFLPRLLLPSLLSCSEHDYHSNPSTYM